MVANEPSVELATTPNTSAAPIAATESAVMSPSSQSAGEIRPARARSSSTRPT